MAKKSELEYKTYQKHFEVISKICLNTKTSIVEMYWKIGSCIETLSDSKSGYGSAYIDRLSTDLSSRYGRGFSTTNLKNMRLFHKTYELKNISEPLEWSHYVLLITIKDPVERQNIENTIISESLSHYEIKRLINNKRITKLLSEGTGCTPHSLPVSRGSLYTYSLIKNKLTSSPDMVTVDCGFNIHRDIKITDPESFTNVIYVRSEKRSSSFSFKEAPKAVHSDLYTYKAQIERVIDGDTLLAVIDCGFHTKTRKRLRLKGIDCAEIDSESGLKARRFVVNVLKKSPVVVLKIHKPDKYERYLTDLFFLPEEIEPAAIAREGILLNQMLIDEGHAVRY